MSIRRTIEVIVKLAEQGVIQQYAIAGAGAALNYASRPALKIRFSFPSFSAMAQSRHQYPDISDILARKAAWRRQQASLAFSVKLEMLDAMRARVAPLIHARKIRNARQRVLQSNETNQHSTDRL